MSELTQPKPIVVDQAVLVLVDVQRDWAVSPEHGGIEDPREVPRTIERIEQVVAAARTARIPIVFCQEIHRPSGIDYGREIDQVEALRCVDGAESTELWPSLTPIEGECRVVKRRCSCFFASELDLMLRSLHATTVILAGGLTDICVHYTFVDAFQRDLYVRVVEDAVIGSTPARHQAALDAMEHLHHGARRTADEVCLAFASSVSVPIAPR
ncbi:MAG TPA: cysteine hydrolase [Acidimicrobiales bacterium]|nr:cysteine hydrolase [Acidimicrobiales bacterium]